MKRNELAEGGHYRAKVNGRVVTVRLDAIRETTSYRAHQPHSPVVRYDVTNTLTGRKTTFRSAAKFRGPADADQFARAVGLTHGQIMRAEREDAENKERQAGIGWTRTSFHDGVYPEVSVETCSNLPGSFPGRCPHCGAFVNDRQYVGQPWEEVHYKCGGSYTSKPQIQNHHHVWWGRCPTAH